MKSKDLMVRCMIRRDGDLWVALCLDFTLAAQARTFEEARDKLHQQIFNYVRDAFTIDKAHATELLSRKAPLRDRLRFSVMCFLYGKDDLRPPTKPAPVREAYCEPLPLQLAAA